MEQKNDLVKTIISIAFLIIYACIQYSAIMHPGTQDDIISARVQDVFIIIVSYYFVKCNDKD